MGKKALLVIDMLVDFIEDDGALSIGETGKEVTKAVAGAIKEAREKGIPVIYICDRHREDDAEFKMFPPHCIEDTPGSQVVKKLAPQPGDYIIPKRRYSAFFGTDLDTTLRELGVDELTLVGVCTNICVLYTAADARMLNYEVTIIKDAVASFDKEVHDFALRELKNTLGARII